MGFFEKNKLTNRRLTLKQYRFLNYYLGNGFNATQAAISSGYKSAKYANVKHMAYENLIKPHLKLHLAELLSKALINANFQRFKL